METLTRARALGNSSFIVIMSNEMNAEQRETARALSAYEYLLKPFDADDVVVIVSNCLRMKTTSTVLVIDDSEIVRKIVRKVLRKSIFKMSIDEAANDHTALVAYQAKRHDIVFLDINRPGINGFGILELLRKTNPDVRVVLMADDRWEGLSETAKAQGVQIFLYKPFFPDQVDRVLYDLFGLRPPDLTAQDTEVIAI